MANNQMRIRVIPNAKREAVYGMADGRLKVKVHVPAERGKANLRATELVAEHFQTDPSLVRIIAGGKSKNKIINIVSN